MAGEAVLPGERPVYDHWKGEQRHRSQRDWSDVGSSVLTVCISMEQEALSICSSPTLSTGAGLPTHSGKFEIFGRYPDG